MKKILNILAAAVITAAAILPLGGINSFAADSQYKGEGYTLTFTTQNDKITITHCQGNAVEIVIPPTIANFPVVTIGNYAFSELVNLEKVTIPDTVSYINESAFWNCNGLKTVSLGKSVAEIGTYAFSACPKLSSFAVSGDNPSYKAVSGMLYSKDGKSLICYAGGSKASIPKGTVSVNKTAFFGNTALEAVAFPDGITEIGNYAFSGCLALKNIKLPDSVKKIGNGCFMNCTKLSEAYISSGITEIPDECFSVCTELSAVNISENIRRIGSRGFFGCGKLSGIYIPKTVNEVGAEAVGIRYNIRHDKNEPYADFYISGDTGSAVEKYAKSSGVDFVDFKNILLGDVDRNGAVNAIDASKVLMEYAAVAVGNESTFNAYRVIAGDFNKDGAINALDASGILAKYANDATKR